MATGLWWQPSCGVFAALFCCDDIANNYCIIFGEIFAGRKGKMLGGIQYQNRSLLKQFNYFGSRTLLDTWEQVKEVGKSWKIRRTKQAFEQSLTKLGHLWQYMVSWPFLRAPQIVDEMRDIVSQAYFIWQKWRIWSARSGSMILTLPITSINDFNFSQCWILLLISQLNCYSWHLICLICWSIGKWKS